MQNGGAAKDGAAFFPRVPKTMCTFLPDKQVNNNLLRWRHADLRAQIYSAFHLSPGETHGPSMDIGTLPEIHTFTRYFS